MEYVVPENVTAKEFNEFLVGIFRESVIEFNSACGKNPLLVKNPKAAADMVLNECKRICEESQEAIQAFYNKDRKERIDGIVDIHWCLTQFRYLFHVFHANFTVSKGDENYNTFLKELSELSYDDRMIIEHVNNISREALVVATGNIISGETIIRAALKVIENNKQKYTDDFDVASDWLANNKVEGVELRGYVYNDKKYYCLKRISDDYIVKPYTFKAVELGGY